MFKRILFAWFLANFFFAGIFALISGGWYLRLPTFIGMGAELGLIILPNLVLPLLLLRFAGPTKISSLQKMEPALGWIRTGRRPILVGLAAFVVYLLISAILSPLLGAGIPYNVSSKGAPIAGWLGLLALFGFVIFAVISVAGEETMFRGLIQTQIGERYGVWIGVGLTILLFGLRHLPADFFYAQIWHATPQMWLAREVDLYLGASLLSLARYFGRSTYASATMHLLTFLFILVQGFF